MHQDDDSNVSEFRTQGGRTSLLKNQAKIDCENKIKQLKD